MVIPVFGQIPAADLRTGTMAASVVVADGGNRDQGPGLAARPERMGA
jgi:hypothetical protein